MFRAIMPTTPTITLPLALNLDVELSWGPIFLNITTQVRSDWLLWSTRAGMWVESTDGPPLLEFLQPPNNQDTARPVPPRPAVEITDVTTTQDPSAGSSTDQSPVGPVEIIEEVISTNAFQRNQPGGIPYAQPPILPNAVVVVPRVNNAITLNEVNQDGLMSFDEGMALVREENRRRDERISRNHENRRNVTIEYLRPPEPGRSSVRPVRPPPRLEVLSHPAVPDPPSSPKPPPPDRPPTLINSMLRPLRSMRPHGPHCNQTRMIENARIIDDLDNRFHPTLLPVARLQPNQLVEARPTRTGTVNPPLPSYNQAFLTAGSPADPLRTTTHGIRLEITPAAMISRTPPEEHIPGPNDSIVPRPPSGLPPELDPES